MSKLDFVYRMDKNAIKLMSTRTCNLKISPSLVKLIPSQFRVNIMMWPSYGVIIQLKSLQQYLQYFHTAPLRFLVFYMKFRIFIEVLFGKQNL